MKWQKIEKLGEEIDKFEVLLPHTKSIFICMFRQVLGVTPKAMYTIHDCLLCEHLNNPWALCPYFVVSAIEELEIYSRP